jgi:hypothetical protein
MLPKKGRKNWGAAHTTAAIIAAVLATPVVGFAQSTYIGGSGGNWSVPGNWNPSGVPGNDTAAIISESPSSLFTVNFDYIGYSATNALSSITLDSAGTASVELSQTLSTASMFAGTETVGNNGTATYNQTTATNSPTGNLYLGFNSTASGTYLISGDATLSGAGVGYIGYSGTGTFTQNDGMVSFAGIDPVDGFSFNVGYNSGANGTYNLNSGTLDENTPDMGGGSSETTGLFGEVIGLSGTGMFNQTGGTNESEAINVGGNADGSGSYSLSGGNITITNIDAPTDQAILVIGDVGTGTFVQSGGVVTITGVIPSFPGNTHFAALIVGFMTGGTGTYTLSDGGTLNDTTGGFVGLFGTGTFDQTGGTATFSGTGGGFANNNLALALGGTGGLRDSPFAPGVGYYNLSGGELDVLNNEDIGADGTGTFTQTGGTHSIGTGDNLYIGSDADIFGDIGNGLYSLSGTGTLTVGGNMYVGGSPDNGAGGTGAFSVSGGEATIDGTLEIWNTAGTSVTISGGSVTAGNTINMATITQTGGTSNLGALTSTGSISVGNSSGASASMTVSALQQNSVTINSTGSVKVTGGSANAIDSLTINGSGKLDLTNVELIVNYAPGTQASVDAAIRGYLVSGYNGGTWTGAGIDSSIAALPANNSAYGIGYADGADDVVTGLSSGQIEVKYTLYGDANLDDVVSGDDFSILVGNLGKSAAAWDKGDFNYDGVVSGDDFSLLVGNLGRHSNGPDVILPASDFAAIDAFAAANGLMADVPEPTSGGIIVLTGMSALICRKRSGNKARVVV